MPQSAVLDGEIVCLDKKGRCAFNDLLFRRGEPFFIAFDLVKLNDKDLRREGLLDRKQERDNLQKQISRIDRALAVGSKDRRGGGRRNLSAAARKRIADAQKKRWAAWMASKRKQDE